MYKCINLNQSNIFIILQDILDKSDAGFYFQKLHLAQTTIGLILFKNNCSHFKKQVYKYKYAYEFCVKLTLSNNRRSFLE